MKKYILCLCCSIFIIQINAQHGDNSMHNNIFPKDMTHQLPKSAFRYHSTPITTDSMYHHTFKNIHKDSLPPIDFQNYYLIGKSRCAQCILFCKGSRKACHQNNCHNSFYWLLMEKDSLRAQQATYEPVSHTFIPFFRCKYPVSGPFVLQSESDFQEFIKKCPELRNMEVDFTKECVLFRYAGGDCLASFDHEFYLNHEQKKLVWQLYNIWGGCRAGGLRQFAVKIPKVPAGYEVNYEQVFID
ncbi:MAG: hypothetical protein ACPGJS_01225 [Flammeovirgaceae bacterium]